MVPSIYTHLDAVLAEQVQHVLINVVHLLGVHSLHTWVEALQVAEQELERVPQLEDKEKDRGRTRWSDLRTLN